LWYYSPKNQDSSFILCEIVLFGEADMLKKIFSIIAKLIAGLFLFYLLLGLILLPLISLWVIPWQGSQLLKTPVKVRSVFFNPFLLRLTVNGFEILDQLNQPVVGFDRFVADMSFTKLFKKIYRIESVDLEGLQINSALLPDGRVNLLDIVPQAPPLKPDSQGTPPTDAAQSASAPSVLQPKEPPDSQPLPVVIVDKITLRQGSVRFDDQTIRPNFTTTLSDMESEITDFSTEADSQTKVSFRAKLDQAGSISLEAAIKPMLQPPALETSFHLNDYALQVLTPYVGKYTGRSLKDGELNMKMDYRIGDNQLTASHKLLIQHFEFGPKVESKDALSLPFGLAVALLEDPQGKISISLPVTGDMSDPKFEYFHLIGQVVKNFFLKLVTKPFSILASIVAGTEAGTEELGYVRFLPGRTDLPDEEKNKLSTLIKGLQERPKLQLEINGSFDPEVDWKAIQKDIFIKDYEALRKESNRSEGEVYQLLYQRRFGIRALWDLAKEYKKGIGDYEDAKLSQEIKRQLIENAPPDQEALSALAQARAQLAHDFFIASGFDVRRLSVGQVRSVQSSMGYVPMEFTLTVFDSEG